MSPRSKHYVSVLLTAATMVAATAAVRAGAASAATSEIQIKDFMFEPVTLSVKAGSVVTWTNRDDEPHTVASDAGLFRSGALDTGEHFMFRFDKPGIYHYVCSIHPRMVGTIAVQ
jgi:plastocyanin